MYRAVNASKQRMSRNSTSADIVEPFLKWPGGKRWLAPGLASILRGELTGTYWEPFLGGGAVFLALRPNRATLSDINAQLIACFETVRRYPERVISSLGRFSNTEDCYYRVRRMKARTEVGTVARFIFLNRTCWGGIYRLNQHGVFNVPFGNSHRGVCSKQGILSVARALHGRELVTADFEKAFNRAVHGDVIYADPPYTVTHEDNGFVRYNERLFKWDDQQRLARAAARVRRRGIFVAVSGAWHPDVLALYPGWYAVRIERHSCISRRLHGRRKVSEVVVFSRRPQCLPASLGNTMVRLPGRGIQLNALSSSVRTKLLIDPQGIFSGYFPVERDYQTQM